MTAYAAVFFLGMLTPLAIAAWKPRTIARLLWSAAEAAEDFRAYYRGCAKGLGTGMGTGTGMGRKVDRQEGAVGAVIAGDVVSGLVNMGVGRRKAEKVVEQLKREKVYAGFEEMFKDAVQAARKTTVTV